MWLADVQWQPPGVTCSRSVASFLCDLPVWPSCGATVVSGRCAWCTWCSTSGAAPTPHGGVSTQMSVRWEREVKCTHSLDLAAKALVVWRWPAAGKRQVPYNSLLVRKSWRLAPEPSYSPVAIESAWQRRVENSGRRPLLNVPEVLWAGEWL